MINASSVELISPVWLKTPYVSIYVGDLVNSPAVYDGLSTAGQVRKQIRKFVAIKSASEELDAKLCILVLVRSLDQCEMAFKETKTFTHRNCR